MLPSERYEIILQKLAEREMMTISELMNEFNISIETVRRDLNHLEKDKKIKRVYGGAILYSRTSATAAGSMRMRQNISEKAAIGKRCAELVQDGDTLYLGPGTTVLQVAKHLKNFKNLTIITDSFYAAMEFMDTENTLYFMGGHINTRDAHTLQHIPADSWDFFHPAKSIMGAGGISVEYGITDYSIAEAMAIRKMVNQSMQVIVVADNSKFGTVHNCATCRLERVNHIITGSAQKEALLQEFDLYRNRFLFADSE